MAWLVPVLAERAHQTNRIFRRAVLLHARTLGPIQAARWRTERASLEGALELYALNPMRRDLEAG